MRRVDDWDSVSATPGLKVLDTSIILASAAFWSWLTLSVFDPAYFAEGGNTAAFLPAFRFAAIAAVGTSLFLFAFIPKMKNILDAKRWEAAFLATSVLGSLLSIIGAKSGNPAFAFAGSILAGACIPYFLLEWCRMYSRRGIRTAAPLSSGAFALGLLFDLLILSLDAEIRIWLLAILPLLIAGALYTVRGLARISSDESSAAAFDENEAFGAAKLFTSDPKTSGVAADAQRKPGHGAAALRLSLILFGIAFGMAQSGSLQIEFDNPARLIPLIGLMGFFFMISCLRIRWIAPVFDIYLLGGVAGLLVLSSPYAAQQSTGHIAEIMANAGFMAFLIGTLTILGHEASMRPEKTIKLFAANLFLLVLGIEGGLILDAIGAEIAVASQNESLLMAFFVVAAITIFPGHPISSAASSAEHAPSPSAEEEQPAIRLKRISEEYSLTDRETEILRYLMMGRSRPRIASMLNNSENTVNSHVQHIYRKANVRTFQEMIDLVYNEQDGAKL